VITSPLVALAVILSTAAIAQWIGGRLKLPSVLFLLAAGMALSTVLNPDEVFGELLFTGVGVGVAVLLFEGGASLRWNDIGEAKYPVIRLVTVGALVTWFVGSLVTGLILDLDVKLALLIGAILIVSGPTVVIPILRAVRPREPTASIVRWEGILIDPVGAGLAIVVLDAILEDRGFERALVQVLTTFGAGLAVGAAISVVLIGALALRQIPDHLQVNLTLAGLVAAYALSNQIRPEAGLVAATLMGMAFANQSRVPSAHIVEFSENLGGLVLGALFIVLGARVDMTEILDYLPASLAIIAVLLVVARPLAVLASTLGTDLPSPHRKYLMLMAPRGVVAAAVASLFAEELDQLGMDPGPLVPVVFTVVLGTVLVVGLGAGPAADRLRVAQAESNGVALIGGGPFAVAFAEELNELEIPTIHIGLTDDDEKRAIECGQMVYSGRIDRHEFVDTMAALGIRHAVALSGIDHLDTFALRQIAEVIGSENLYALHDPSRSNDAGTTKLVGPRTLLPPQYTAGRLRHLVGIGVGMRTIGVERLDDPGWVSLCRVIPDTRRVVFTSINAAGGDDLLIQFGPDPDIVGGGDAPSGDDDPPPAATPEATEV
jgi:NhaP-type Na+/H+ or K+/H+ antiporter